MTKTKTPKTVVKPARLTSDMRLTFVAAVMADVPQIDYEQRIRDAVNKAHAAALPAAVKKMLADPELAGFINVEHFSLRHTDGAPPRACVSFNLASPVNTSSRNWLDEIIESAADPLLKEWCAQEETRDSLKRKLRTVADSCATTTKLAEAFPEFARYLPQTEAQGTRNLPALANVVTDFVKAGWPANKKAPA